MGVILIAALGWPEDATAMPADAGSIEKYGIELAMNLAVRLDVVMRRTYYDSPHLGAESAPFRSGLHRL